MSYSVHLPYPERSKLIWNYVKNYPNKILIIQYKTPYAISDGTAEEQDEFRVSSSSLRNLSEQEKADEQLLSHMQRAKTKISDIVDCNDFDMFVTFTSNCKKCGQNCKNDPKQTGKKNGCICDKTTCKRYDLEYQRKNTCGWLNHQKTIHGYFYHLMVMELHKDGAYHFHALLYGYKGKIKKHSKDRKDGKMIYNLVENKRGNTTCKLIPHEEKPKVASYVKKYIKKDMPLFPGRKRYFCSKGLKRPVVKRNADNVDTLLNHPAAIVWKPKTELYVDKRTHQIVYPTATNVESITTIELDNTQNYLDELELSRKQKPPRLSGFALLALRARSRLSRMSAGAGPGRFAVDSSQPGKSGL